MATQATAGPLEPLLQAVATRAAPAPLGPLHQTLADGFAILEFLRLSRDDRPAAAAMIRRLRADPTVDPWSLLIMAGQVASSRPCGRHHPQD
jgi:hypothetical protein